MPAGAEVTVPLPLPALETERGSVAVPLAAKDTEPPGVAVTVNWAARAPGEVGVKVTAIAQPASGARGAVQPLAVVKSALFPPEASAGGPDAPSPALTIFQVIVAPLAPTSAEGNTPESGPPT